MKRKLTWLYFLIGIAMAGCTADKINIPEDVLSTPASITHLRKVQLKDKLQFGTTAIKGLITSDVDAGNIPANTLIVQEEGRDAAMVIELSQNHSLKVNTEIVINLEGSTLLEENGELKIKNIPAGQLQPTGREAAIAPKSTSLSTIRAEGKYWGPILVRLENLNLTGGQDGRMNGVVQMDDGIASVQSEFDNSSVFASEELPEVAQTFLGIIRINNEQVFVNARNLDDVLAQANEAIEDFENASSTNYDTKILEFKTGPWTVDGGITATTSADLKTGAQSIRLQGSTTNTNRKGILAMNFDIQGVKKLKVSHGIYPAAAETSNVNPTTLNVEISKDGGATYTFLKQLVIDTKSTVLITDVIEVNAAKSENVRIRLVNSSLPFANNNLPRINIDDIVFEF